MDEPFDDGVGGRLLCLMLAVAMRSWIMSAYNRPIDLPFTSIPSSIFLLLMRRGMWPPRAERDGAPARAMRASRRRCARFFTVATCTSMIYFYINISYFFNKIRILITHTHTHTFKPLETACLLRDLNATSRSSDFSSALALRKACLMASFRPF